MRQITRGALRKGAFGITSPQTSTPDMNTGIARAVPSSELEGDTASPVASGTYSLRKRDSLRSKLSSSNSVTGAQDDEAGLDEQQVVLPSQFPYTLKNCGAAKFRTGLRKDLPPPSRAEIELLCDHYNISVIGVDTSKLVDMLLAKKRYVPPKKQIPLSDEDNYLEDDYLEDEDDSPVKPLAGCRHQQEGATGAELGRGDRGATMRLAWNANACAKRASTASASSMRLRISGVR